MMNPFMPMPGKPYGRPMLGGKMPWGLHPMLAALYAERRGQSLTPHGDLARILGTFGSKLPDQPGPRPSQVSYQMQYGGNKFPGTYMKPKNWFSY